MRGGFKAVSPGPEGFDYTDPPYGLRLARYAAGGLDREVQIRFAVWLKQHPSPAALTVLDAGDGSHRRQDAVHKRGLRSGCASGYAGGF